MFNKPAVFFYLIHFFFLKQPHAPVVHRIVYYKRLYIFFQSTYMYKRRADRKRREIEPEQFLLEILKQNIKIMSCKWSNIVKKTSLFDVFEGQ